MAHSLLPPVYFFPFCNNPRKPSPAGEGVEAGVHLSFCTRIAAETDEAIMNSSSTASRSPFSNRRRLSLYSVLTFSISKHPCKPSPAGEGVEAGYT